MYTAWWNDVHHHGSSHAIPLPPDTEWIGDQSGKRWKFIGPCFVNGLMFREGSGMAEPKGFVVT